MFRRFNLGGAVIAVLDHSNFSFFDGFIGIERRGEVKFRGVELCFRANVQGFGIQQITLARLNFTQAPIIAADIGFCRKLTILIGRVSVHKLLAVEHAVFSTCECSVTLRQPFFTVGFRDGQTPFFENIVKSLIGDLIPLNGCRLLWRHHIFDVGIHFFEGVRRIA